MSYLCINIYLYQFIKLSLSKILINYNIIYTEINIYSFIIAQRNL